MGLRSGLPDLRRESPASAAVASQIQLAQAASQLKVQTTYQSSRSNRGQPLEAPHLDRCRARRRHPEVRALVARLEGWPRAPLPASFEARRKRLAPQDDVTHIT